MPIQSTVMVPSITHHFKAVPEQQYRVLLWIHQKAFNISCTSIQPVLFDPTVFPFKMGMTNIRAAWYICSALTMRCEHAQQSAGRAVSSRANWLKHFMLQLFSAWLKIVYTCPVVYSMKMRTVQVWFTKHNLLWLRVAVYTEFLFCFFYRWLKCRLCTHRDHQSLIETSKSTPR